MKNKDFYKRGFCFFIAITLLSEIAFPTAALALTSGPDQPETQSFEPVGTTEMVDFFSGDFNYNIPLLTVPGPNGGYPLNLSYHAGISPEQEASWVGLGWNLNVGSVNRSMRGLPDDFFGQDVVKKSMTVKPSWTFGMNFEPNLEVFGLHANGIVQAGIYYNNYKGLGTRLGIQHLSEMKKELVIKNKTYNVGVDISQINFDSQEGTTLKPKLTLEKDKEETKDPATPKNPRFPKIHKFKSTLSSKTKEYKDALAKNGSAVTFANPSFSPRTSFPEGGFDASLWVKFGGSIAPTFLNNTTSGYLFFQHIKDNTLEYPAYGYLHLGERNRLDNDSTAHISYPGFPAEDTPYRDDMGLMDFNRYNDNAININAPNLAVSALTYDVFNATAQGMGMVFRPHRTDLGMVYDPRCTSDFTDARLGIEVGMGPTSTHIGLNPGIAYTNSYEGKWKGQYNDLKKAYEFTNSRYLRNDVNQDDLLSVFKEPYYFKSADDMCMSGQGDWKFGGDNLFNFEITSVGDLMDPSSLGATVLEGNFDPANYSLQVFPKVKNQISGPQTIQALKRNKDTDYEEDLRANSIEYKTRYEISNTSPINTSGLVKHLYKLNEFPYLTSNPLAAPVDYALTAEKKGHHIAKFSIVNPDGNTYEYGLPVYNIKQKDVAFSTDNDTGHTRTLPYDLSDASLGNQSGSDRFFYSTEIPSYTHSHLLTTIFSADYVDVTSNGPSDDDLGYFVKFNYSPLTKENTINSGAGYYKWRTPFSGAIRMENYEDHDGDDKAAYLYGEKEIYYLNSIETKTHFAIFELNDNGVNQRNDSYGASSENDNGPANPDLSLRPRYLKKIKLYSKQDLTTPLKTAHFNYDYSLCPNTLNSIATNRGKLTLTSLYFTYLNNDAGSLSPYEFTYNTFNPSYHELLSDPWGTYKEDITLTNTLNYYAEDFPFVDQDKVLADKYAAAWCLQKIKMPSGAEINVEYEADDYQYVQDKPAMQMLEIAGTGYDNGSSPTYHDASFEIDRQPGFGELHDLIVFKLKKPTSSQTELNKYVAGIKNMYFKANLKLKKVATDPNNPFDNMAYDYVDGYCKVNQGYGIKPITDPQYMVNGEWTRAYIKVEFVKSLKLDLADDGKLHPFRKAAFEYMKLRRPELFFPINGTTPNALSTQFMYQLAGMFAGLGQAVVGFNRYCKWGGFGKQIADGNDPDPDENDNRKSYIRLNTPDGFKYGGGHRVKKIYMDDKWNPTNQNAISTYGQEYYYLLENKTSSGVAEYEPLYGGGAENPLKLPNDAHMNEQLFIANLKELYQETPICEGYYPGANVGYSRITVKSLTREVNNVEINRLSGEGITVNEFYTAYDYPVRESVTKADNTKFSKSVIIPFIGGIKLSSEGYSQGYNIVLNDMHGKPRAIKVYPHNTDVFSSNFQSPVHEVNYTYSMNGKNLNNVVSVLLPDGAMENREIGTNRDFVMDMDQQSVFTIDVGLVPNADVNFTPPALFGNVLLNLTYNHKTVRKFVNVKAIYKSGVLIESSVKNDKAETVTKNLMFDAYSGRPLLTQMNNEFKDPVYTYEIPAHWYVKNMGNRAQHYNSTSAVTIAGSNVQVSYPNYFNIGDKVRLWNTNNTSQLFVELWVKSKTGSSFTLTNEKGQVFTASLLYNAITLIDPARKNQLNTNAGLLVSLSNPVVTPNSSFLTDFNSFLGTFQSPPPPAASFDFANCLTGLRQSASFNYIPSTNTIEFISRNCRFSLQLPAVITGTNYFLYEYYKSGNSNAIQIKDLSTNAFLESIATWVDNNGCIPNCLDDVLHAESYVFSDNWSYDYADFGDPFAFNDGQDRNLSYAAGLNVNPYKYGANNQWRLKEKYLYQVERKQTSPHTDIMVDGTYKVFNWYNWMAPGNMGSNKEWTLNNKITKYSPYGFEVENADIHTIFSSNLYGHNNAVIIATGANIPYNQLSSQSFEEPLPLNTPAITGGHLNLWYGGSGGPMLVYNFDSHTGNKALKIGGKTLMIGDIHATNSTSGGIYHAVPTTTYILSFWVKNIFGNTLPLINLPPGAAAVAPVEFTKDKIDGWQRMEVSFVFGSTQPNPGAFAIDATAISDLYIDDIRIQPVNAAVTTYVYDAANLWLKAELDEQNYATFYNYDESGNLVQIKKETVKGISTVMNSRKNTKRP